MYGNEFAGRPTASGEPYDPGGMTAAHPTLPMGTIVSVSGPGGAVIVRINDRGPFVGGRIIDLSQAAAAAVGLNGLASVTITVQS
jgi:rare lipoprotein A